MGDQLTLGAPRGLQVAMPGKKDEFASTNNAVWTTTKAMRRHIIERLKDSNLFKLSECKLALKHLCSLIVTEAKTDFEQLLYLDAHYRASVMPKLLTAYDTDGDGILSADELEAAQFKVPKLSAWDIPKMSVLPDSVVPIVSKLEESLADADENDPTAKLQKTIIAVHTSMLRIISINNAQRQDRLHVMKALLGQLSTAAGEV